MKKKDKKIKKPQVEEEIVLDIPEDEIWTYQIEGLAAPHINKPYKHYTLKKIIFTLTIIVAVGLSMFFTVRTVHKDTFEYKDLGEGTYELTKFSNTGDISEFTVDYYITGIETTTVDGEVTVDFKKDESKVITEIKQYCINEDNVVKIINIGKDVEKIDGKAFYSCWALQRIEVDEENPYYCDIDGVLYSKDKKTLVCHPCDRDTYLCEKYGYEREFDSNGAITHPVEGDKEYPGYLNDVLTFVVPSSVETIGELAFNYACLQNIYLPEGLKKIETLGIFEIPLLANIYSYIPEAEVTSDHFTSNETLGTVYNSLPEGLEYIGSDAFSYNQAMSYVYIPSSVTYIGHHAFWDTVYKQDGNLMGVTEIHVALSEEEFKEQVDYGDHWRPQYDYLLFKKDIDTVYSAERS